MDTRRLGIFHQRYLHTISETTRTTPVGVKSATGRFFIFYRGIASLFRVARCAHFSPQSPARGGPCGTTALQTDQIGTSRRDGRDGVGACVGAPWHLASQLFSAKGAFSCQPGASPQGSNRSVKER